MLWPHSGGLQTPKPSPAGDPPVGLSMTPADLLRGVEVWHVPIPPSAHPSRLPVPQQAERIANEVAETLIALTSQGVESTGVQPAYSQGWPSWQPALVRSSTTTRSGRGQVRLAEYRSQPPSQDRDEGIASLSQAAGRTETCQLLRQWLLQLDGSGAATPYTVSVLDPAVVPVAPCPVLSSPTSSWAWLPRDRGAGACPGAGVAGLHVATPEELEDTLGLTVLGAVARIGGQDTEDDPIERLVARNYPRSPIAEAFRTLRTNIRFARPDMRRGSLLITSAQPGEGKSLVASNLAVAVAQEGRTAIIIDADLRRPSLHRFFGLPNRVGFTSLIMDEDLTPEDALHDTDVPGLRVITSGPLPPNPLDMLASQRAQTFSLPSRACRRRSWTARRCFCH